MAYSRNEYLKQLNQMRSNYQNNGNAMINTLDDTTNVGEELSSFAYMNTPIQAPVEPQQEKEKSKRNGWQRTVDTTSSFISNVTEGVTNFLDDIWDFSVVATSWLTGLVSGVGNALFGKDHSFEEGWKAGTSYVEPATTAEWEPVLNNWWNQMNIGNALLSGDVFTGEWEKRWANLDDKSQTEQLHKNSWANEWGDFGQGIQQVEQGVGYVLPSLVLAYFTGGSSLLGQAGIQAGVMGTAGFGSAFETATKEGADYGEAVGYGAVKGAIAGGTAFLTTWIGGNAVAKNGGSAVSQFAKSTASKLVGKTGNKTLELVAGKAIEMTAQAGISGTRAYLTTLADPALKTIYNDKSLEETYSGENLKAILDNAKNSAVVAFGTSLAVSSLREVKDLTTLGKDGYYAKYYAEKGVNYAKQEAKEIKKASDEFAKTKARLESQFNSGKISATQLKEGLKNAQTKLEIKTSEIKTKIETKILESVQQAQEYYDRIVAGKSTEKAGEFFDPYKGQKVTVRNPEELQKTMAGLVNQLNGKDISSYNLKAKLDKGDLQVRLQEIAKDYGVNTNTVKTLYNLERNGLPLSKAKTIYVDADGNAYLNSNYSISIAFGNIEDIEVANNVETPTGGENGAVVLYKAPNGVNYSVRLNTENDTPQFEIRNRGDISTALTVIEKDKSGFLPAKIEAKPNTLSIPETTVTTGNNVVLSKSLAVRINDNKEIQQFLETKQLQNKGAYVLENVSGQEYKAVVPYQTENGNQKYAVITVNNKTNAVKNIEVGEKAPVVNEKFSISPKINNGKADLIKYDDGTPILFAMKTSRQGVSLTKVGNDYKGDRTRTFYVMSKRMLTEDAFVKENTVSSILKKLKQDKDLFYLYERELTHYGLERMLDKLSYDSDIPLEVILDKLGVDSILTKDNELIAGKNIYARLVRTVEGGVFNAQSISEEQKEFNLDIERDKQRYVETIETTKSYEETNSKVEIDSKYRGSGKNFKVIKVESLPKSLQEIVSREKKAGLNINFAISNEYVTPNVEAYIVGNTTYAFIDNIEAGCIECVVIHEKTHFIKEQTPDLYDAYLESPTRDYLEGLEVEIKNHGTIYDKSDRFIYELLQDKLELENGEVDSAIEELIGDLVGGTPFVGVSEVHLPSELRDSYNQGLKLFDGYMANIEVADEVTNELNPISKDLADKYKDSKIRNDKHQLIEVYHGTDNLITKFDPKRIGSTNGIRFGRGYYFTDAKWLSTKYGNDVETYLLNITNPYMVDELTINPAEEIKRVSANLEKLIGKEITSMYPFKDYADGVENDIDFVLALQDYLAGYYSTDPEKIINACIKVTGRDGVWAKVDNQIVAWKNSQINLRTNVMPTDNPDVRFSVKSPRGEGTEKLISDLKLKSSTTLIEDSADANRAVTYRVEAMKEGLNKLIQDLIPKDATYKLEFPVVKQAVAELDLAKISDLNKAVNNVVVNINNVKVYFNDEKMALSDILTDEQASELKTLVRETLQGAGEPSKFSKWVKKLNLQNLETQETRRNVKELNKIKNTIKNGTRLNYGLYDAPKVQLTVFDNIVKDIQPFWTNKSITQFANNILTNYTETNLKEMFDNFGIPFDRNIAVQAQNLLDMVVAGRHLNPQAQALANDLLHLLNENIKNVESTIRGENQKVARRDINIVQATNFGKNQTNKLLGGVRKVFGNIESRVTSPVDFVERYAWDTEYQHFLSNEIGKYENEELTKLWELNNYIFKELAEGLDIEKELSKTVKFKGKDMQVGNILHILNLAETYGDNFYKAHGFVKNADSTRGEIDYTPEDIANMRKLVSQKVLDYNERVMALGLNKKITDFSKEYYKKATGTELRLLDTGTRWYPAHRISDNNGGATVKGGSIRNFDLSFLNERVNSRADIDLSVNMLEYLRDYISKLVNRLVWKPAVDKLNTLQNTRVVGRTFNKVMQQNVVGWDDEMDLLYNQILQVPYETQQGLLSNFLHGVVGNLNAVRVATVQAGIRTLSSAPFFASFFGAKYAIQGQALNVLHGDVASWKKNYDIIVSLSSYFKNHFDSYEVVSAQTGVKIKNKMSKIFGIPLTAGDMAVHLGIGFSMAQAQAEDEGYGKPYTATNNKRAVELLEQASKKTQPTNAMGRIAKFRYGNSFEKLFVGLYGSMKQAFLEGMYEPVRELVMREPTLKRIDKSIQYHEAKIEEYKQKMKDSMDAMNNAGTQEDYEKAENDYEKAKDYKESHEESKKNTEEHKKKFSEHFSKRKILNRFTGSYSGLLFASLMYVAIKNLLKVWEGKQEWSDIKGEKFIMETIEQGTINSLPYLSTLWASIRNDSDLSIATLDNMNNVINSIKDLVESIESGNTGYITGSTLKALEELSQFVGIPLQSYIKLINGTWYNIDKLSNLKANGWLGNVSASKLKQNYKDAYTNGQKAKATANLETWAYLYSIKTSQNAVNEIYRLNRLGYTGITPSAIPTKYTNDLGATVKLTKVQYDNIKQAYAKADAQITKLLTSSIYANLDDEYKAKAIDRVYSYYYEWAKTKGLNTQVSSKIGKLLDATNGDLDLAKYILGLQQIAKITEDKKFSRKENVLNAINKMAGFTKAERLLLAYLGGYAIGEKNQTLMVAYLSKLGFSRKDAIDFLS